MSEIMTNSQLIKPEGIPRKKKVVICGSSMHTAEAALDFYNKEDWEVWGLNQLYKMLGEPLLQRADRWFQIHHEYVVNRFDPFQIDIFKNLKIPVYMIEKHPKVPYSIPYPLKEILAQGYHEQYFSNIISYMMALAIYEDMENIYLTGCDMAYNEEYRFQRPGVEFFIGYARGKGINVGMSGGSGLLKTRLYAYESNDSAQKFCKHHLDFHEKTLRHLLRKKENKHAALWRMKGARDAAIELNAPQEKIDFVQAEINRLQHEMNVISAQEKEGTGMIKAFTTIQQIFYGMDVWDSILIEPSLDPSEEELKDE